jgi:hypothetical protein
MTDIILRPHVPPIVHTSSLSPQAGASATTSFEQISISTDDAIRRRNAELLALSQITPCLSASLGIQKKQRRNPLIYRSLQKVQRRINR